MNLVQFIDRHPVWTWVYLLTLCATFGWCTHDAVEALKWWTRR